MAVSLKKEPLFDLGQPKLLFRGTYVSSDAVKVGGNDGNPWDIDCNGKRFLMLREALPAGPRKINVVLNWLEELKQHAPAK